MTYQHLSQTERYQIDILMKDGKTQTQITATDWGKTVDCLLEKWSPVQIADQVDISMRLFTAMSMLIKPLVVSLGTATLPKEA